MSDPTKKTIDAEATLAEVNELIDRAVADPSRWADIAALAEEMLQGVEKALAEDEELTKETK